MTALAALGCDPTATGDDIDVLGGASLGTIGYSNDGGLYMAIKAQGAISQYELCFIAAGFEAIPKGTNATAYGRPCCIPQLDISDDEYGWGLVAGAGRVRTDGGVANNNGFQLDTTNEELDTAAAGGDPVIVGMVATGADGANDGPMICMFPSVGAELNT